MTTWNFYFQSESFIDSLYFFVNPIKKVRKELPTSHATLGNALMSTWPTIRRLWVRHSVCGLVSPRGDTT